MKSILTAAEGRTRALVRASDELETADRLLGEAFAIGLWSQSDDGSDRRTKVRLLREVDWAVSGAHRALASIETASTVVSELLDELRSIVVRAEALADQQSDADIMTMRDDVAKVRARIAELVASQE